jgi:fatty acid desaturase
MVTVPPKGDLMQRPIRATLNAALVGLTAFLHVLQFILLPLWLVPHHALWLLLLVPCALFSNILWYLVHEGFHQNLHPLPRLNNAYGHVLAVAFGAPFHVLRFGHLMHHRFNGALIDRPDLFDPGRESRRRATIRYYFNLCGGFYLQEVLSACVFLLPRSVIRKAVAALLRKADPEALEIGRLACDVMLRPKIARSCRVDAACTWALVVIGVWAYGGYAYTLVVAAAARAFLVSVANNLPHYGTPPHDRLYAMNFSLPWPFNIMLLNFNCHRVHHHDPLLPWNLLPAAMQAAGDRFDITCLRALVQQFRGPLPTTDFKTFGTMPEIDG